LRFEQVCRRQFLFESLIPTIPSFPENQPDETDGIELS
jgi:hypothetical protein